MKYQVKLKTISIINLCFLFCFHFCLTSRIHSIPKYKEIEINGLEIHTEQYLIEHLNLKNLRQGDEHFTSTADKINNFYHQRGHTLAKTYLIKETNEKIRLFVDEGRLGRIVFMKLNAIRTLWMKYEFKLKHKIYNKFIVQNEINRLKEKYGFETIQEVILPIKEYDKAIFQLDDEFSLPGLGKTSLPFFEEFGYRYNLFLIFKRPSATKLKEKTFDFALKTSYSKGLIPKLNYYNPSLIQKDDLFVIGTSIGIRYLYYGGIDVRFNKWPYWTFMEVHSDYHFAPALKEYFTPLLRMSVYNSKEGRLDLGLSKYKFLQTRGTVAPGITFLNQLKIYAGFGGEKVKILDPEIAENTDNPTQIERHVDNWVFFETMLVDKLLWMPGKDVKKKIKFIYNYYINKINFHKISFKGEFEFELKNHSIYTLAVDFIKAWKRPPFYHEVSVSDSTFKGLRGGYFSRRMVRNSNEYQISIYRSLVYGGVYTDLVWFQGFDRADEYLSGEQYGIVSGLSGHVIFLDQFEFYVYYGKDYIYPAKKSQFNLYMKMRKKI